MKQLNNNYVPLSLRGRLSRQPYLLPCSRFSSLRAVADRAAIQSINAAPQCHPELRERAEAQSENHAFRGTVFRESSKTDSGSDQRYVLPLTLEESASLGLRLALNANARACNQERGLACRALDSAQGKPCSVALLGLAFTMAEILLSLTIIGVVAAITLPSLTGNINQRTWNTQRKALYARFSQAIALMPALNGYGTLTEGDSSTSAVDTAAETFVTSGLAKVMKINNICDYEHLEDCGFPTKLTPLDATSQIAITDIKTLKTFNSLFIPPYLDLDTKAAAFETNSGESFLIFYNPRCTDYEPSNQHENYVQNKMCANFVYDLNGAKGPNTVGKDIGFLSVLYPSDSSVVAPELIGLRTFSDTWNNAVATCKDWNTESRLPNLDEAAAIFFNAKILGVSDAHIWTSTSYSKDLAWKQSLNTGRRSTEEKSIPNLIRCIKR